MSTLTPVTNRMTRYLEREPTPAPGKEPRRKMVRTTPPAGPGTEFGKLAASLGLKECFPCGGLHIEMDQLGVEGCRREFDRLVAKLKENRNLISFWDQLKAGALAVKTGLAFHLNPLDPLPGMLEEAIRRAEEQSKQRPQESLP